MGAKHGDFFILDLFRKNISGCKALFIRGNSSGVLEIIEDQEMIFGLDCPATMSQEPNSCFPLNIRFGKRTLYAFLRITGGSYSSGSNQRGSNVILPIAMSIIERTFTTIIFKVRIGTALKQQVCYFTISHGDCTVKFRAFLVLFRDIKECSVVNQVLNLWDIACHHSQVKRSEGFRILQVLYGRIICHMPGRIEYLDSQVYLTKEDMQFRLRLKPMNTEEDSLRQEEADEKARKYLELSLLSEVETLLKKGITQLNSPDLTVQHVDVHHDTLVKKLDIGDSDDLGDVLEFDEIIDYYQKVSGNEEFERLKTVDSTIRMRWEKDIAIFVSTSIMDEYLQEVEMPGLITHTNSVMLEGNVVRWHVSPMSVMIGGNDIYIESRVTNVWAFAVTGLVLLGLVVILLSKMKK